MNRVFVYGTLKSRHLNAYYMRDYVEGKLLGKYKTPRLFDLKSFCKLPALIPGEWHIDGELYEVSKDGLEYLDHFESNGRFYNRVKIEDFWVYMISNILVSYVGADFTDNLVNINEEAKTKEWIGL